MEPSESLRPVESVQEPPPKDEKKDEPKPPIEEEKAPSASKPPLKQQETSMLDFRSNRFFGMINGFLGFLTRRKKAYTGRPSSAMYYDEKKKRYVIDGEESSDDDLPPPPPPKKKETLPAEEEVKKQESAADSLTRPAFAGALANRGRGRGRGGMPMNRFPQTFGATQLAESAPVFKPAPVEEPPQKLPSPRPELDASRLEEQNTELYTTGLDITVAN